MRMRNGNQVPLLIAPRIQRYDWGDPVFLPRTLRLAEGVGPCAEAWYGAHPSAPAAARIAGAWARLDHLMRERGPDILGPAAWDRFGALPYLLKLLAAASPLSIQVHPPREQAEAGFAAEEAAGVPRSHPSRRYRDPHAKPELLVALTDFDVLHGFRSCEEIAAILETLPEVRTLLPSFQPTAEGLRAFLRSYYALPGVVVEDALRGLLRRLKEEDERSPLGRHEPAYWVLRAHEAGQQRAAPDRGLLLVYLMSLVHLRPGEALFTPPGVLHAYLRGAGVELMASSDNVLRAGLTSKHVDPEEVLRVARVEPGSGPLLEEVAAESGVEWSYPTPVPEAQRNNQAGPPGHRGTLGRTFLKGFSQWTSRPVVDAAGG